MEVPEADAVAFYGVLAYAFLSFVLFSGTILDASRSSAAMVRGFPGHVLVFYYMAFVSLYSYLQVQKQDLP